MVQVLQATTVSLDTLVEAFSLEWVEDGQFFSEWLTDLPDLSDSDRQCLDKIRSGYFNLLQHPPLLEKTAQLSVLSPLLLLADLFLPPFHLRAEDSIEITAIDGETTIRGLLDVLVLKDNFWLLVVESKQAKFSVEAGLSQLLSYMLGTSDTTRPVYGLVTTGGEFLFVKLMKGDRPRYATSDQFVLRRRNNELYDVFRILKRISQL